jgi:LSU ribosomal protein L18P
MNSKKETRLRRSRRTRHRIRAQQGTYRLSVHGTPMHMYAQLIAPDAGKTVAAASTLEKALVEGLGHTGNVEASRRIGVAIAERAKAAGVTRVAFDRSGFKYHGRVKALADAARENGLEF